MEANKSTRLNAMQQYMLGLFEHELQPEQQMEVKQLLSDYFARLVDREMDAIVLERDLTGNSLEEAATVHRRTPYVPKR